MKNTNSLGKRFVALVLSVVMMLGMLPTNVFAVEEPTVYGVVESLTEGVTINETGKNVKVSFAGSLNWVEKKESVGRNEDGWWIGLKVTAPDTVNVEKAKYISGGQEKNFKDYNDSADDAAVQYIEFWSLVKEAYLRSANQTDGFSTYTWRFDWDGNGEYEQTMTLDIDADETILYKDGNTQVFPAASAGNGTVAGLTVGTSVSEDGDTSTVTYAGVALKWVEKDPTIGRNQDGWWIGMKITAPAQMTKEADFTNVTYQRYESGAWSAAKSFWNAQDSKKEIADTARYLEMWGVITPEYIAKDDDGILSFKYRFDWNQDGIYEQKLTMKVDASTVTLLDENSVQVYPALGTVTGITDGTVSGSGTGNSVFQIENAELAWFEADTAVGRNEDGWWVGMRVTAPAGTDPENAKFRRKVSADAWTDAMAFAPDDGTLDTMQLWGRVTAEYLEQFSQQDRNMNYVWQFDWDNDGDYEQTVTMTVVPSGIILKQSGFTFAKSADTVTYGDNGNIYTLLVPMGGQAGTNPVYSIEETEAATLNDDGTLTIHKAGDVVITATLSGAYYEDITASYTLTVNKADQPDFGFSNPSVTVTWQEAPLDALELVNALGDGEVIWSIKETDVATVAEDGKITLLKADKFTLQAQKVGDDRYNDSAVVEAEIKVLHKDQEGFGFATVNDTVTYNDADKNAASGTGAVNEYTMQTSGGQSTGTVTYKVIDGDAAAFDKAGVLTIKKSGGVKIEATKAGDDRYNKAVDYFTLTIEKADQSFTFAHDTAIEEKYGLTSFETKISVSEQNSGVVTYDVSENTIGASVGTNGVVSFVDAADQEGSVTVTVTLEGDDCYNAFFDTYTITLEYETVPTTAYTLDGDKLISDWFTSDVTIAAAEDYQISYSNKLIGNTWADFVVWGDRNNTKGSGDGYKGSWNEGEAPVVYLKHAKTGAITNAIEVSDLKRDTVAPTGLAISYKTSVLETIGEKIFGINATDVKVTVTATDATSGVGKMEYSLNEGNTYTTITAQNGVFEFIVPVQSRGQLWLRATDVAGNAELYKHLESDKDKILVVDNTAPGITVGYAGTMDDTATEGIRYVNGEEVIIAFEVSDENYDLRAADPVVTVNGVQQTGWTVDEETGNGILEIRLTAEGDYTIHAEFTDRLDRKAEYQSEVRIDRTKPVIESDIVAGQYYDIGQTFQLKVTEHNFDSAKVVLDVEAVDSKGDSVLIDTQMQAFSEMAKDMANWSHEEDTDIYTLDLPITVDGNYTVTADCTDDLNWTADTYIRVFSIDTVKPVALAVTYNAKNNFTNKILNAITFGHHEAPQEAVLTMTDATSGIDYIKLFVTADDPASATNVTLPENLEIYANGEVKFGSKGFIGSIGSAASAASGGNLTLSFDVPAQFRGKINFVAYDKSGNDSEAHADPGVLVMDTIAPEYTISYNASNVVKVDDMTDLAEFNAENGMEDAATVADEYVMYFSTDAVATIQIAEANFDPAEVSIEVQNAAGVSVQNWEQTDWKTTVTPGQADVHTKTVTIADEGDYRIMVQYQDYSKNTPVDYLSQWIVVDKKAPDIQVQYHNTDVKNNIDKRDYFITEQSATITITEHNFRADDVVIKVTAENITGDTVLALGSNGTVQAYAEQGADRAQWSAYESGTWRRTGDEYEITLNYTAEANYTFDIEYKDLAKNPAANYEKDLFTVDKTAPKCLKPTYSTNVFEQVKQKISFGYYDAQMTVTISAEDDISGVNLFDYSYIKGKNVSDVNDGASGQTTDITRSDNKFTASFHIPKKALGSNNQFNGTVEFTAYDWGGLSDKLQDSDVIIVDNIAPTAKVTFNEPVQKENDISYYDGDIDVTIVIDEANFDSKDVKVSATKDGEDFPVKVAWRDKNVDIHTGTFTLTEDGDYVVSVEYTDKSGNKMKSYISNQLTLDATKPTIQVSNIKANSANKDAAYGFMITVNDTNLDVSSIKPVLKAVVQQENGAYVTVDIDLGDATAVVKGQTYTYTVENLPDDGLYTLTCYAKDMSANTMSQIVLEDGKAYDQLQFSINRNGSTFGYGNTFTEELVGQYYIYSVEEDVVIVEVNVDPIEEYKVSLNGKELAEGTDYTTEQTSNDGEWSKRTYAIKKSLFEAEGEYSIIVSSTDKTETSAFSDVKNLFLAFVVDQTKPVLTITGLEAGGRYQTNEQTVTLIPTDEGGRLNSLSVTVLDSNGNPLKDENGNDISVRFEMSGEELLKYLEENDGKITFTIPEGLNNQVKIICNDCAVNAENLTNEYNELFKRVTVSQNQFVIFYANTPLFIGAIAGVLAIIALIIFLIKRMKDKKAKV